METFERFREIRKDLKLSQEEFGKRLGVSRSVIVNIECDRLKRPDQKESLYKLVCKEFNVNEEWLRTGNGSMYIELSKEEYIADFISSILKNKEDSFKKRYVAMLSKLDEDGWEALEKVDIAMGSVKKD